MMMMMIMMILLINLYQSMIIDSYITHTSRLYTTSKNMKNEVDDDNIFATPIKWFNKDLNNDNNNLIPTDINDMKVIDTNIITIPIFPLIDNNCFPGSSLPLNIFVMKFRSLFNDIQNNNPKLFGVCMSKNDNQIVETGTICENINQKLLPDGRQLLSNVCRQRFRVKKIIQYEPYMLCEVEYPILDKESTMDLTELPIEICNLEREVFQTLQDVFTLTNKVAELQLLNGELISISETILSLSPQSHPFRLQYATDFSFAICDQLGTSPNVRQLLLETETVEYRLIILRKLLRYARTTLMNMLNEYNDLNNDNDIAFN